MCCRVFNCCCCFDLRRGVQVLGIIFLILNIIGMVSNIISLSNTKTYYSNCMASNAATINTASQTSTQSPFDVMCDGNVPVNIDTLKYWDKNYGAILGVSIGFEVLGLIVNVLLIWGATVGNRCMLLPWLILSMMAIVLVIVLLVFIIIGCAILGVFALAGGYIAIALIFPTLILALWLYWWIVVQSLYKQIGEEKMDSNAVSPMYGGGRVTHHNNWSQDEEFAYNKA